MLFKLGLIAKKKSQLAFLSNKQRLIQRVKFRLLKFSAKHPSRSICISLLRYVFKVKNDLETQETIF